VDAAPAPIEGRPGQAASEGPWRGNRGGNSGDSSGPRRAGTVFSSRNLMAWQCAALPRITKQTNELRRGGEKLSIGRVRLHDQNQGRETGARKPLRDLPIYRR